MNNDLIVLSSQDGIPKAIRKRLDQAQIKEDDILIAAEGDLSQHGQMTCVWLVATSEHVAAIAESPEVPIVGPFKFKETENFKLRSTVGSTCLQTSVDGLHLDLVRFSNGYRERFGRVLSQLKRLKDNRDIQKEALLAPDPNVCPECGLTLPDPNAPCPKCIKQGAVLFRIIKMMRGHLMWAIVLFLLVFAGVGMDMLPPYLTKILVDDVLTEQTHTEWLLLIVAALAGAHVFRNSVNILINRLSSKVGTQIAYDVRRQLFDKLQRMSVDYYDKMQAGDLMSRVSQDVEELRGFIDQATQGFLVNIILIFAIGGMLFHLNASLAFYILIPIPFVILGTVVFWRYIYPKQFKIRDSRSKFSSMLYGVLSGIRLVKAFAQEDREKSRFLNRIGYLRDSRRKVEMSSGTFYPMMAFVFSLGGLIVWYVGGKDVLGDKITLGTLMAFLGYIGMFYSPLSRLTFFSNWLTSFMTSSQRIFEILDTEPGIKDDPDAEPMPEVKGDIEFDVVVFGYDPYSPVIKGVSISIESGAMIGIVGKSGSGKTTLINLLCRFYDVQEGSVRIDGKDVRDVSSHDLRSHVGLVLQEPFLIRASVAENIAYSKPGATPEEIINAAKAANAHDFIMRLPSGYDTMLGERGSGLSGGERQRVSIARALLCDPAILILDEATSSVDTESERQIQEALAVLSKGRTTIAIAHRLSTLRGADRIYVIDDGTLAEHGNHDELMAKEGIYSRLVRIQTELAAIESD